MCDTFRPTETFGAGVDRIPLAAADKIFTDPMIRQILSAGWQTVTYRQNTELKVEEQPNATTGALPETQVRLSYM